MRRGRVAGARDRGVDGPRGDFPSGRHGRPIGRGSGSGEGGDGARRPVHGNGFGEGGRREPGPRRPAPVRGLGGRSRRRRAGLRRGAPDPGLLRAGLHRLSRRGRTPVPGCRGQLPRRGRVFHLQRSRLRVRKPGSLPGPVRAGLGSVRAGAGRKAPPRRDPAWLRTRALRGPGRGLPPRKPRLPSHPLRQPPRVLPAGRPRGDRGVDEADSAPGARHRTQLLVGLDPEHAGSAAHERGGIPVLCRADVPRPGEDPGPRKE